MTVRSRKKMYFMVMWRFVIPPMIQWHNFHSISWRIREGILPLYRSLHFFVRLVYW